MPNYDRMFSDLVSGEPVVGLDSIGLDSIGAADLAELQEAALAKAAGGAIVRQQKAVGVRVQPMPANPLLVTAALPIQTVEYKPQRLVLIHSFIIPSINADNFDITDISVGQMPQFITKGSVPGAAYSEVADGRRSILKFDSADVGNLVTVTVQNISGADDTFRATFVAQAIIRA